jgi:hypothetical protein
VEIVCGEFGVVVRGESWDELDDCSSNERVSMILVLEDLVADFDESIVHKL